MTDCITMTMFWYHNNDKKGSSSIFFFHIFFQCQTAGRTSLHITSLERLSFTGKTAVNQDRQQTMIIFEFCCGGVLENTHVQVFTFKSKWEQCNRLRI